MHFWLGEAARHHAQDQAGGTDKVAPHFLLNRIGYNLIRIPKLLPGTGSWGPKSQTRHQEAITHRSPSATPLANVIKNRTIGGEEGFLADC